MDAPLLQRFDEHGVHLHIAEHHLLVAQEIADLVDVEFQKVLRLDLVGVKILQHAAAAVGLAGVTSKVLFHHQHVGVGVALFDGDGAGKSADAAAEDQNVTGCLIIVRHSVSPHLYFSKFWSMCSLA